MKKLFTVILLAVACFSAYAQESSILDEWSEKIESKEDDVLSAFSFANVTYNYSLGAQEGYVKHGWGFEISSVHLGFNPWKNGRFTLGLFDMTFDFGYLFGDYKYIQNIQNKIVPQWEAGGANKSRINSFAYMFPLGYVQKFGNSKWDAAIMVSPGIGWNTYSNDTLWGNVRDTETLKYNRGYSYFRLDAKLMIWYNDVGIVARFSRSFYNPDLFPGIATPTVISAGISLKI